MLPSTLKYRYSIEPVGMHFPAKQPYCTNDTVRLFRGKVHSDWFNGIETPQGRWQHAEKVGYCYSSGLEKTLCKWDLYVPLVMKGCIAALHTVSFVHGCFAGKLFPTGSTE
jgi:hypothetical protein